MLIRRKLAVIFPGIGYHCDKPLLYYTIKMLKKEGYEIIEVPYTGFPYGVKDNPAIMEQALQTGLAQAEEILKDVQWLAYEYPLFVSKSIGTVIAARYAAKYKLYPWHIYQTPLEILFREKTGVGIAFHGTNDSWADTDRIEVCCEEAGIPLYLIPDADHSLETGDVVSDIEIVADVVGITRDCLKDKHF